MPCRWCSDRGCPPTPPALGDADSSDDEFGFQAFAAKRAKPKALMDRVPRVERVARGPALAPPPPPAVPPSSPSSSSSSYSSGTDFDLGAARNKVPKWYALPHDGTLAKLDAYTPKSKKTRGGFVNAKHTLVVKRNVARNTRACTVCTSRLLYWPLGRI